MKNITILGSTGSIGKNALEVAKHLPSSIRVVALAAKSNIDLLEKQAQEFAPQLIAVYDKEKALELQKRLPHIQVVGGMDGVIAAATFEESQFVLSALVGAAGILPTLRAVEAGKTIGLANKETLVAAGELIMRRASEKNVAVLPIDSEHNALFQCMHGEETKSIMRLILTASGGPFFGYSLEQLEKVSIAETLKHPTWQMGKKVTVDSATLMNKGLEVIEAHHLFGIPTAQIEVVVHPQSVVHSFVEFIDGSLLAQLGPTDMKGPIQYAMTYPHRLQGSMEPFDFTKHPQLNFFRPQTESFPCLDLAYAAIKEGGTMPCFMNGVNEVLVDQFLEGKISFLEIGKRLEKLMGKHQQGNPCDLETLLSTQQEARVLANNFR